MDREDEATKAAALTDEYVKLSLEASEIGRLQRGLRDQKRLLENDLTSNTNRLAAIERRLREIAEQQLTAIQKEQKAW